MKRLDLRLIYVWSGFEDFKKRLAPFGLRKLLHLIKQSTLNLTQMNAKKFVMRRHLGGAVMAGAMFLLGLNAFAADDPCNMNISMQANQNAQNGGTHDINGTPYNYEMWTNSGGNGSMKYFANEDYFQFHAEWNNPDDLLCRLGLYWGTGPKPDELDGDIHCDFNYTIGQGSSGGGYNYICIYGWTKVPNEVEYYIVENTFFGSTQQQQGLYYGANKRTTYTIEGEGTYDLWIGTRTNAPSISGTSTFTQVFAVRTSPRTCGHISVSEHMRHWKGNVTLGQLYDCKFLCEVGSGSGKFDLNYGKMWIGDANQGPADPEFSIQKPNANQFCKGEKYNVSWNMNGDPADNTYTLNWGAGTEGGDIEVSKAKASSEWGETASNPMWTADKILKDDGSHGGSSRWGTMTGSNEWVELDLGKVQSVGGIKIDECTEYDVVSAFEVHYDDNGTWKKIYSGTTIGHDFKANFSHAVTAQKFRLAIKSTKGGDGCNINYVQFTGVPGYVIKEGIKASGSVEWTAKNSGSNVFTITNSKGKVIASSSTIKVENCGGEEEEYDDPIVDDSEQEDPGTEPGNNPGENPQTPQSSSASSFFDENGSYFGPDCDATN
ncbi:MAG: glycoside hydrolase family 11 protein, partial [Paludibacteraceae bacterium]|nr:glycoside hydrolase family 11 protein [Paludibacteraceae bacterium]